MPYLMSGEDCVNCGDANAETYDMQIRNTRYREVSLCETCHASIERELGDGE